MQVQGKKIRQVMSANSMTGDKVINRQGENLGDIEDFMIDLESGSVAYCVLSFGGFLGLGDKLFAVPFQALTLDEEQKIFILDVSKERLKNAPGFDKNNWPDMSSREWGEEIFTYYGYEPYWKRGSEARVIGGEEEKKGETGGGGGGSGEVPPRGSQY